MAEDVEAPFLGNLAMSPSYRDTSKPTALLDGSVAEEYSHLATGIRRSLQELGREAS